MTNDLHRLVYYSRNRIVGDASVLAATVAIILRASQLNNAAFGVTGALMFNSGYFGQVLEGRREHLEATFERIQRDERHSEVSLLAFEPLATRTFGHWSMGFVGTRPDHTEAFAHVAVGSNFDPSMATGDRLVEALVALALEDEAAAA